MPGPLEGVRILDLTSGVAGPMATMTLGDQGADVIKVELPNGDPFRRYGGYTVWNRGKRSVALDLKRETDHRKFLRLVVSADVLIEGHAPGTMARLGLSYNDLKAHNSGLVYCSLTGYGRHTKNSGRPGYDLLVQARSGQQYEQPGWREGPIFLHMPMPSMAASYLVAAGVSAALYVREITGRGQWVETSLYQGVLAFTTQLWQWGERMDSWYSIGKEPQPAIFQCADGEWVHSMHMGGGRGRNRDIVWEKLGIDPIERPVTTEERVAATEKLRRAFGKLSSEELLNAFWAGDIPIQVIQPAFKAFEDPQVIENGMVVEVDDPIVGKTKQVGVGITLHKTPGRVRGAAPNVGQHTEELLAELRHLKRRERLPTGVTREHALQGIKVLDFGNFLAGPFGPMILSDLGAEVIKLESPDGDQMRHATMPFHGCQRGKRDISVDLKHPEGVAIARRLMAQVDVVHHNMRPGVAERLGIGYETARELNPSVIYCHTPAYGVTGPRASWPGFDQLFQAMCGCEWESGGEGNPPVWYRFGMCDTGNALQSVVGVLMALYHRERTGEGQFVDTNLLNCGLYYNSDVYIGPDGPFQRPRLDAAQTGLGPLYRLYQTNDGWIALVCMTDEHWRCLTRALDRTDLLDDVRFATALDRETNAIALSSELEATFAAGCSEELFEVIDAAGVPCEISDEEATETWHHDEDLIRNGLVVAYEHPEYGEMRQFGHLIEFSDTPGRIFGPPPMLGQHTREIMADLGYSTEDMMRLEQDGAIRWSEG